VTSLDPGKVSPEQLLKYVRGHWQIENCLHFVKDRWWDEDRHWTRRPGLAERLAAINSAALNVLRKIPSQLPSLRQKADLFCWKPKLALQALGIG